MEVHKPEWKFKLKQICYTVITFKLMLNTKVNNNTTTQLTINNLYSHIHKMAKLTSGGPIRAACMELTLFWRARICNSALNGARQIGQLLAWYLKESAQELHKHKWRQGKIKVSRTSHIQITHSDPLSSVSSSPICN